MKTVKENLVTWNSNNQAGSLIKKEEKSMRVQVNRLPDLEHIVRRTPCNKPGVRSGK